jgi:uncharacterized protein YceK
MRKILIMITALSMLSACAEASKWSCASDGYVYEERNGVWTKVIEHNEPVQCARQPGDKYEKTNETVEK